MRQVKAKYIVGLTATPVRKDGHQSIIFMQCGPIRFDLSAREAAARSPFRHLVLPTQTDFRIPLRLPNSVFTTPMRDWWLTKSETSKS